ncbi:cell division protein FtsQ [Ruminiclostridium sufflavum DSM 19573]|uniref:Cell division protein FtsQ n=1 Tax=Ruminiclostridium sufflavum DSM 19573 TaxID=1121337 RepID=A0A318YB54_9FIRM|nr:FtsQ-type POTRA domain-containing protein [Ruminiclostridium sufflavum]PYG89801.1 cell division protein FtsQ [Ruminiclostridium sufflavum DSM 19573]
MTKTSKKTVYRKTKDGKKRRAVVRRIRKLISLIVLIVVAVIFARSSFFIVDEIKVSGSAKYSPKDIIAGTGLVTGQNIFKMLGEKPRNLFSFRFIDREQSVYQSMPYVKSVSVRPSLPKAIKIRIQERTPFAILEAQGTSMLIDSEGYALEAVKNSELKKKYFKIIGTSVDSFNLGQAVKFKGESPLSILTDFCDKLLKSDKNSKLKLYEKITSVKVTDINCITARFEDRINVEFGDYENLDYNINFFRKLYTDNITKQQKGTFFFKAGSDAYFEPED